MGLFSNEVVEPIHFPLLETPLNSFRVLLGETQLLGQDGGVLDTEDSSLLQYKMPDFSFELLHLQPMTVIGVVSKFIGGLTSKTKEENKKQDDGDGDRKKKDEKKIFEKGVHFIMGIDIHADYAFDYDTTGLDRFARTGDAANIFSGFFMDVLPGSAVLLVELIGEGLALRRGLPGVRPEAEVDRPPVVPDVLGGELGNELVEIHQPASERQVHGRLVVAVGVLVAGVVGVDQVHVIDAAAQLVDEFGLPARQDLLLARLARTDDREHVPVARVVEHAEVRVVDGVQDAQHVRGLV